jgi:CubicO group peptidase (beta-lactamase class C family)
MLMTNRTAVLLLVSVVVHALPLSAQVPSARSIDSIFAAWDRKDSPGCALGVVQDGRLVYTRGYGSANLDYDLPNGPAMVYYSGSVSKQFTAAAIALLAEQGRIALDDEVRKYIPELPDYGRPLTIRHLVHHTSGLRDIYVLMDLAGLRLADVFPDDAALKLIVRQKELNFAPGDAYLYSNSGYFLLSQVVKRVTASSLREYAEQNIFRPLGMSHTHFHDQPERIVKNRVISYMPQDDGFRISYLANFDKIGAGGLYTTIEDLLRWDQNFYAAKIGGPRFLETLHTRGVLNNGDTLDYAFGLMIGTRRGLRTVRHSGSMMGFKAELVRYPDERFSVITLCNLGPINPTVLADRVADLYLGRRMRPVVATGTRSGGAGTGARLVVSPALRAEDYTGTYHSEELDVRYSIAQRAGRLELERPNASPQEMRATEPDVFAAGNLGLRFERASDGRITGFTVQAGRVRNIRFVRTE